MDKLTYKPTINTRPFCVGETVLTLDRNGEEMERQKVVRVGPRRVRTDCGRSWSADGHWAAGNAASDVYPFPSITPVDK